MSEAPRRLVVGEAAPQIALMDSDGNQWRSEDHRGQSIVVIFHRHIH